MLSCSSYFTEMQTSGTSFSINGWKTGNRLIVKKFLIVKINITMTQQYLVTLKAWLMRISLGGGDDQTPFAWARATFSWLLLLMRKNFASRKMYCNLELCSREGERCRVWPDWSTSIIQINLNPMLYGLFYPNHRHQSWGSRPRLWDGVVVSPWNITMSYNVQALIWEHFPKLMILQK